VYCPLVTTRNLNDQFFSSLQEVISSYSLCQASDETYPIQEKLITHSSFTLTSLLWGYGEHIVSFAPKTYFFFSISQHINLTCIMTYVTRVCLHDLNNLANKLFTTSHQASWLAHQTNSLCWLRLHLRLR
jgi:hypothetical protein